MKLEQVRNQLAIPSDVLVALFKDSEDNEKLRGFFISLFNSKEILRRKDLKNIVEYMNK